MLRTQKFTFEKGLLEILYDYSRRIISQQVGTKVVWLWLTPYSGGIERKFILLKSIVLNVET
jgi:hypothetical protein